MSGQVEPTEPGSVYLRDGKVVRAYRRVPAIDRLLARVVYDHGCWTWVGPPSNRSSGYAVVQVAAKGRPIVGHRVAYEALVGPIPDGMQLDHLCRNRRCVNPTHLEVVTSAENTRRGMIAARTRCCHGHPYDEANTRVTRDGRRHCIACDRAANARRVWKKAA